MHTTSLFPIHLDPIDICLHHRSSLENYTRFQTKIGKVYNRFQTKTAQKPYQFLSKG